MEAVHPRRCNKKKPTAPTWRQFQSRVSNNEEFARFCTCCCLQRLISLSLSSGSYSSIIGYNGAGTWVNYSGENYGRWEMERAMIKRKRWGRKRKQLEAANTDCSWFLAETADLMMLGLPLLPCSGLMAVAVAFGLQAVLSMRNSKERAPSVLHTHSLSNIGRVPRILDKTKTGWRKCVCLNYRQGDREMQVILNHTHTHTNTRAGNHNRPRNCAGALLSYLLCFHFPSVCCFFHFCIICCFFLSSSHWQLLSDVGLWLPLQERSNSRAADSHTEEWQAMRSQGPQSSLHISSFPLCYPHHR